MTLLEAAGKSRDLEALQAMVTSWLEQPAIVRAWINAGWADIEGHLRVIPLVMRLDERALASLALTFLLDAEVRNLIAQYISRSHGISYKQAKADLYDMRVNMPKEYAIPPQKVPNFVVGDYPVKTLTLPDGSEMALEPAPLPPWVAEYMAAENDLGPAGIEWLRGQPGAIQEVMVQYPPMCLVRAKRPMQMPAPGEIGFVAGVSIVDGEPVVVVAAGIEPEAPKGECRPEDLVYVAPYGKVTPERVAEILAPEATQ